MTWTDFCDEILISADVIGHAVVGLNLMSTYSYSPAFELQWGQIWKTKMCNSLTVPDKDMLHVPDSCVYDSACWSRMCCLSQTVACMTALICWCCMFQDNGHRYYRLLKHNTTHNTIWTTSCWTGESFITNAKKKNIFFFHLTSTLTLERVSFPLVRALMKLCCTSS